MLALAPLWRGTTQWLGRPRDWKHCAHVLGPHLAEGHGVARQRTALIPQDGQRLAQRTPPIQDTNNFQIVPMRSEGRRNNSYPVLGFGEDQQGMWRAAFEPNVGPEAREPAGCVESSAKPVSAIQQEQWMRREVSDLDRATATKGKRRMAGGEELGRFQRLTAKVPFDQWNPIREHLTKVYLAAFQHCQNYKAAPHRDPNLHVGITLRVPV